MYKLISATTSPYVRKVRIALAEKGLEFELLTEVPWDSTTTTPLHNPLEKVPILILPDGSSIYDSAYILEYLELKHPEVRLVPADVDGHLEARKLEVLGDGICDAVVLSLLEGTRPDGGSAIWRARQRRKIDGAVAELARVVGEKQWAVRDRFGLGDIAIGSALGYLSVRFTEMPWRTLHPNLARYGERLEQRPSFRNSVPTIQTITDQVT